MKKQILDILETKQEPLMVLDILKALNHDAGNAEHNDLLKILAGMVKDGDLFFDKGRYQLDEPEQGQERESTYADLLQEHALEQQRIGMKNISKIIADSDLKARDLGIQAPSHATARRMIDAMNLGHFKSYGAKSAHILEVMQEVGCISRERLLRRLAKEGMQKPGVALSYLLSEKQLDVPVGNHVALPGYVINPQELCWEDMSTRVHMYERLRLIGPETEEALLEHMKRYSVSYKEFMRTLRKYMYENKIKRRDDGTLALCDDYAQTPPQPSISKPPKPRSPLIRLAEESLKKSVSPHRASVTTHSDATKALLRMAQRMGEQSVVPGQTVKALSEELARTLGISLDDAA